MPHPPAAMQPLKGHIVIDVSRYLPGPYLTRILADLGADVIKVEPPGVGDAVRYVPPNPDGLGPMFAALHAGKQSIALDIKAPQGAAILRAMCRQADIVVETFRPGVMAAWGLDYETLKSINPKLIMCSISGYGADTDKRADAGHDINYVARAGALGLFGPADSPPVVPGIQIGDMAGGSQSAAIGILAALLEREATGAGRHLDISMTRSTGALAHLSGLANTSADGGEGERGASFLSGGLPAYRVYPTQDNRFMALGALETKFFDNFCRVAACEEFIGKGLLLGPAGQEAIDGLTAVFRSRTQSEWIKLLDGQDTCCEPVNSPREAVADTEIGMTSHTTPHGPVVFSHVGAAAPANWTPSAAPALGADTDAVLNRMDIEQDLIVQARAVGAIV